MTNGFGSGGFGSQGDNGTNTSGFGSSGFGGNTEGNSGFGSNTSGWGSSSDGGASGGGFGGGSFGQPENSFASSSSFSQSSFGADSATSSFGTPDGSQDFGGAAGPAPLKFGTGPWHWVSIAIASAVIGLILGIVAYFTGSAAGSFTSTSFMSMAIAGWVIGGILTFIFLGMHIVEDTKRRANGPYIENSTQVLLYRAAVGVGFIAIVITAIEIALVFAK